MLVLQNTYVYIVSMVTGETNVKNIKLVTWNDELPTNERLTNLDCK